MTLASKNHLNYFSVLLPFPPPMKNLYKLVCVNVQYHRHRGGVLPIRLGSVEGVQVVIRVVLGDVGVLVVVEAVAAVHRPPLGGVHHVRLAAAIWLRHTVGHCASRAPAQSLVAAVPTQPLLGPRPDQGERGQRQSKCQQQGQGQASQCVPFAPGGLRVQVCLPAEISRLGQRGLCTQGYDMETGK